METTMEVTTIAKILKYTRPSKLVLRGYANRFEKWESIVMEFALYLPENVVRESFLEMCGFYE